MDRTVFLIWVLFFVLEFFVDWILNVLNLNRVLKNRETPPEAFAGLVDEATYRRSAAYTLRRGRFGFLRLLQNRVLVILVLALGVLGSLENLVSSWGLPPYWHGLIFLAIAFAAVEAAGIPASLYSRFVIEEEFGFNTAGIKTAAADLVKSTAVSLVLLMALLGGLYGSMAWIGRLWWLAAWAFAALFQLVVSVLYPVAIAPMFNKFEALRDGELRSRLEGLASRCNFAIRNIYTMDGSRRSRHSNAYFTGIGRFRRIVIFDTLMESLATDEAEAVLAHEIGHWKHGHIRRSLILSLVGSFVFFALAGLALEWPALYLAFNLPDSSLHGLIFWAAFFSGPFTSLLSPAANALSRRREYQADSFAAEKTGGPDALRRALLVLGKDNLTNLTPHPAYSFWHYSHPAPAERLARLEEKSD